MTPCGVAFGDGGLMPSPPSRSRMGATASGRLLPESGFGGWVNEKIRIAREAVPYHYCTLPMDPLLKNLIHNI